MLTAAGAFALTGAGQWRPHPAGGPGDVLSEPCIIDRWRTVENVGPHRGMNEGGRKR